MKAGNRRVLVCDCGGTMHLDGRRIADTLDQSDPPTIHQALCRRQIGAFEDALHSGEPLLVACTQEAPAFTTVAGPSGADNRLRFVNIRERAVWSDDAKTSGTQAKVAALLADAAVDEAPTPTLELTSTGRTLIYGGGQVALDAAAQVAGRLASVVVLADAEGIPPPRRLAVPIYRGTIATVSGHFGAFEVRFESYAPADPSSRRDLQFVEPAYASESSFDLIIDLSGGAALLSAPEKREGYFRADPARPGEVQIALLQATDLVGTFDKPRYVAFKKSLCAHSRSHKVGCTRCVDVCPVGAIASNGDAVAIDPHVCAGCGQCAAACPTGAATYQLPPSDATFVRLRALFTTHRAGGGEAPILLFHDGDQGDEMICAIGRFGRGLPARVLPFSLNAVTQVGLDLLAVGFAFGAESIAILGSRVAPEEQTATSQQIAYMRTILYRLGYGDGRLAWIDDVDPDAVESRLYELASRDRPIMAPATFLALGSRRDRLWLALDHLYQHAPAPVEQLDLPLGAPFGSINVQADGCTLCLACVSACPTGAITDNPERPRLSFREDACVQCGLCRNTCPEAVISLEPRLDFTAEAKRSRVLHEEPPFECIRCGKPFGVASTIERMLVRLRDHPMFSETAGALERIKMCEDCRVVVQFEAAAPMATRPRPRPRTTDDYRDEDSGGNEPGC